MLSLNGVIKCSFNCTIKGHKFNDFFSFFGIISLCGIFYFPSGWELFFGFNVFKYITFRAAMGSVTAFLLCILVGPWLIKKLAQLKIGENIIHTFPN